MSIQKFAFELSKKIHDQFSIKIARSHVYELVSLTQGYKTYSAFLSKNFVLTAKYNNSEEYEDHNFLNALTLEILKTPPETDYKNDDESEIDWDSYTGDVVLQTVRKIILKLQKLIKINVSDETYFSIAKIIYQETLWLELELINFKELREEFSYIEFENGLIQAEDHKVFSSLKNYLDKIKVNAEKFNNPDAYAVLAYYYRYLANQIAPHGRDESNFGMKWDNTHYKYIPSEESKALLALYDQYITQAEIFEEYFKYCPQSMSEIDLYGNEELIYKQLIHLCNQGQLDAIEYFLYNSIFKTVQEAYLYIYLARMCGTDFTKSDFRAYNAYTGEAYDDYGPVEIGGRDAIQYIVDLAELEENYRNNANMAAIELFEKL